MATLGDHARQQGPLVEPDRLRFDFAHFTALTPDQLHHIEQAVNGHVFDDPQVRAWHADRAEADAAGAIALFGEKYGERVRIVDIGDFSRELCGGAHVSLTSSRTADRRPRTKTFQQVAAHQMAGRTMAEAMSSVSLTLIAAEER
ncbi:hypothetical protein ACFW4X_13895 [Streptomyces smyrnaeus]|uniref:hypothetical protein n=1 Tax=Streptomyces smyrnaeus TaxID=1387713 RepID=UPI00369125A1